MGWRTVKTPFKAACEQLQGMNPVSRNGN